MIKFLLILFISAFALTGTLNTSFFIPPLAPKELVTLFTFIILFIFSLFNNKSKVFKFDWADKIFFIYIVFITCVPYLINISYQVINQSYVFGYFIPLK